jgi:hypothetical protein
VVIQVNLGAEKYPFSMDTTQAGSLCYTSYPEFGVMSGWLVEVVRGSSGLPRRGMRPPAHGFNSGRSVFTQDHAKEDAPEAFDRNWTMLSFR